MSRYVCDQKMVNGKYNVDNLSLETFVSERNPDFTELVKTN